MGLQTVGHDWVTSLYDPIAIYFIVLGSSLYTLFCVSCLENLRLICWRAGFVVLNSLSFCLYVKLLISPPYLNEIFAGYSHLDCRLFSFITLSISCHSLLSWRVSVERSSVILMGIPLCVICCFPLAVFNICSLCLIFFNLINMCLGVFFFLGLSCLGLSGLLGLGWLFPSSF